MAILERRLLLHIGQVGVATTLANVLLYLFQLVIGRGLGPREYGLFGALFGIVYLASALANGAQVTVAKFVASARAAGGGTEVGAPVTTALFGMILLGGGFLVAFSLGASLIAAYLHSDSAMPVVVTGVVISLFLVVPVVQGALQGAQKFYLFAAFLVVYAGSRLGFGLMALGARTGIIGVLGAVGLASLLTAVLGLAVIRPPLRVSLASFLPRGDFTSAILPALIATLAIVLPGSADVFLVRHFFPAEEAGLYAGVAILGKVVLFLPGAIVTVLFPRFTHDWTVGDGGSRLLYSGLGLTALVSGGVCGGFLLFPGLALSLLLGAEYVGAASLVPFYAAAMLFFSLSVVLIHYNFAAGRQVYFYLVLLPHLLLEVVLIYVIHQSLTQVLLVVLGMNVSLLAASYAFTLAAARRSQRKEQAV